MSEPKFIKATPGPKNSVIYETDDGRKFCFSKGNWTWRNNNPGNLVPGDVSKRNGAIGKAGGFAVFPDYETGHGALIDLLKNTPYRDRDLKKLIEKYAPPKENKTARYLRFLRKETGVKDDKKVKDFTESFLCKNRGIHPSSYIQFCMCQKCSEVFLILIFPHQIASM
jgi:hypothetical protein